MKRKRSTFRRRGGTTCNAAAFGFRALFSRYERRSVVDAFAAARAVGDTAPMPRPGETHRQLAVRLRAEAAAPAETPQKPARSRKKAAA